MGLGTIASLWPSSTYAEVIKEDMTMDTERGRHKFLIWKKLQYCEYTFNPTESPHGVVDRCPDLQKQRRSVENQMPVPNPVDPTTRPTYPLEPPDAMCQADRTRFPSALRLSVCVSLCLSLSACLSLLSGCLSLFSACLSLLSACLSLPSRALCHLVSQAIFCSTDWLAPICR